MPTAHLIGVPLDLGGNRRGVDMGPSAIRISGLAEQLVALGVTVVDKGDIPSPIPELKGAGDPHKRYVREIARVCAKLHQTALASLHEGALPIVLGGDHSLGAGSVAASPAGCAHDRSPSASSGWMRTPTSTRPRPRPLATFMGCRWRRCWVASRSNWPASADPSRPCVPSTPCSSASATSMTARRRLSRPSGIHAYTMKDVDRLGIAGVMERALAAASDGTGGIHVSFDLELPCDPSIAPGVGTPVKGGLDYREAHYVMEVVAESGRLMALDLVEVNPALDLRNTTAEAGHRAGDVGAGEADSVG